jgi:hypothetical protein
MRKANIYHRYYSYTLTSKTILRTRRDKSMTWKATVEKWLSYPALDAELKQQLILMQHDEKALEDSFYKNLESAQAVCVGKLVLGRIG